MSAEKISPKPVAAGFTMIELLIAIMLLLVGVVAVAQLIPAAMTRNLQNRYDSTGLILAQRQLELMTAQSMEVGNPAVGADYFFNTTQPNGTTPVTINMGLNNPAAACPFAGATCSQAGATVVNLPSGQPVIDWTQAPGTVPANYIARYVNAEGYQYQTRWNVVTFYGPIGGAVRAVGKRIIISTRGGPPGPQTPTTLVTMVGMK
jgi:prepilin-type N-terminal cleavage/methylation domain-containing protein